MDAPTDTYKTLAVPTEEFLMKVKKSKFFSIAYPVQTETEVKTLIEGLRKKHHTANHVCYAWSLGLENPSYRTNDDGEPNNSAGMPIYGQIIAFDLKNVLVAVTRVYGGTKLGVGGLISAYRETAKMALQSAKIIVKTISQTFELRFDYSETDVVMRIIKQNNYQIIAQEFEMDCRLLVSIPESKIDHFKNIFESAHKVLIKKM